MATTGLSRTCTAGSQTKGTLSVWFKRGDLSREQYLLGFGDTAGDNTQISLNSNDTMFVGTSGGHITLSAYNKFRTN